MSVRRFDIEAGGDEFTFEVATEPKISFWLSKYPEDRARSAVIPLLWLAQKDNSGWLSEPAMREVADRLNMPYIRVYEVATFYTMFRLSPVGKYHVQLCGTTPCMLRGANDLKSVCESVIGQKSHVTDTGRLSWEEVECLGACVNAPMVQINDYYYEDLTPESFGRVLDQLANGVDVEPGTFVERVHSAPAGEARTLVDPALYDGSVISEISSLPNSTKETVSQSANDTPANAKNTVETKEKDVETVQPKALSAPGIGGPDDLKLISGIGPVLEDKLNNLGVFHFWQIAKWGEAEVAWVDDFLSFKGRIGRERWIPQATTLAEDGKSE